MLLFTRWKKKRKRIASQSLLQNRTELSINSLTMGDIGNYTCSAAKDKFVTIFIFSTSYYSYPEVMTVMVASVIVMMMTIVRLGSGHHTVELTQRNLLTVRSNQGRCWAWKMQKPRPTLGSNCHQLTHTMGHSNLLTVTSNQQTHKDQIIQIKDKDMKGKSGRKLGIQKSMKKGVLTVVF